MVIDYSFLAEFINPKCNVERIIIENGFELSGQFKKEFIEFVDAIRKSTNIILEQKIG